MKRIRSTITLALLLPLTFTANLFAAPPAGYYLVWADECNGSSLDTTKWQYRFNGPNRDAYNTSSAVSFNGSNLVITTYTSGGVNYTAMLMSYQKFESKFGYWESSVKWSDSNAVWSAFWFLPHTSLGSLLTDPVVAGLEIDAAEHRYADGGDHVISDQLQVAFHYYANGSANMVNTSSGQIGHGLATGFHTFVDGQCVFVFNCRFTGL